MPDPAQGAADVITAYYALIGERKLHEAWQLWDGGGAASGMSAEAFAASFAKYRDCRAQVGAPGRVEAGAGQRYVTVAVKVRGTLQDGSPFVMSGSIILHRVGDIDGATPAQRQWRISESHVRPGSDSAEPSTPAS